MLLENTGRSVIDKTLDLVKTNPYLSYGEQVTSRGSYDPPSLFPKKSATMDDVSVSSVGTWQQV